MGNAASRVARPMLLALACARRTPQTTVHRAAGARSPTKRRCSPRWKAPTSCRRARASAARSPSLSVRQGDAVKPGQVIAVVGDEKLMLQINSLDAQIAGLQVAAGAGADRSRRAPRRCSARAPAPRSTLDQARTALDVATAALRARTAERAVAQQNLDRGPGAGAGRRPGHHRAGDQGHVVLNGDTVATIGEQPFVLRLRIPERHARVPEGRRSGPARRRGSSARRGGRSGTITLVYPADRGRPRGGRREGARISATISSANACSSGSTPATRPGFVVPDELTSQTRFGIDYVRLRRPDGS